jgi:predicted phosphodiesterase
MRIFVTSDLHTDFKENRELIERLSGVAYQNDALIVAGDVADQLEIIRDTLKLLRAKFQRVFFMPGNHELWIRTDDCDSIQKLQNIIALCDHLGVDTRPAKIFDTWIVPLFSWYDSIFDLDAESDATELQGWADFYFCKWPAEVSDVCAFFLKLNESNIKPYDARVISFSHFLPRRDLLPTVEYLRFKSLPKVAGCAVLDEQIRRLGSSIHVFGHSHISCDRVIDGVRYVQHSLQYPKERTASSFPIKMIWNTASVPARYEQVSYVESAI